VLDARIVLAAQLSVSNKKSARHIDVFEAVLLGVLCSLTQTGGTIALVQGGLGALDRLSSVGAGAIGLTALSGILAEIFRLIGLGSSSRGLRTSPVARSVAFGLGFGAAQFLNASFALVSVPRPIALTLLSVPLTVRISFKGVMTSALLEVGLSVLATRALNARAKRLLVLIPLCHGALNGIALRVFFEAGFGPASYVILVAALASIIAALPVARVESPTVNAEFSPSRIPKPSNEAVMAREVMCSYSVGGSWSQRTWLGPLNLQIGLGESVALVGPNGAGKTTILRLLAGLLPPSRGELRVFGTDMAGRHSDELRKLIGYVPDEDGLYPKMQVGKYLEFFTHLYGYNSLQEVDEFDKLLDSLGLKKLLEARIDSLSKGTRQKLVLARALIPRPKLLLLDEPTTALDLPSMLEFFQYIARLKRAGCAVVLSTHDFEEARQLADRIALVHAGRIVWELPPAEAEQAISGRWTFRLRLVANATQAAQALEVLQKLARQGILEDPVLSVSNDGQMQELLFATRQPITTNPRILQAMIDLGLEPYLLAPVLRQWSNEVERFDDSGKRVP